MLRHFGSPQCLRESASLERRARRSRAISPRHQASAAFKSSGESISAQPRPSTRGRPDHADSGERIDGRRVPERARVAAPHRLIERLAEETRALAAKQQRTHRLPVRLAWRDALADREQPPSPPLYLHVVAVVGVLHPTATVTGNARPARRRWSSSGSKRVSPFRSTKSEPISSRAIQQLTRLSAVAKSGL